MNSHGLMSDVRRVVLRSDVFALAVAVVIGTALFQLLYGIVDYLLIPFVSGIVHNRESDLGVFPLYSTFNGYTVFWGQVLGLAITLGAATAIAFLVRRRLATTEHKGAEEDSPFDEYDFRACPECLSQIPTLARRCAFCAAEVGLAESKREEADA